jgi:D-alanine-D-alanine ligase
MKVCILLGGPSAERAVSLVSGAACAAALRRLGHEVSEIDLGPDVAQRLADARPDVVFNALHGTPGEDGSVQGLCALMGLRITHSGVAASAIAIDKVLTKRLLMPLGIPMPGGHVVASESLYAADPLPRPYVLKPVNEGSSVGVAIVAEGHNAGTPIARDAPGPWRDFAHLLAEPFIPGRELTVAVLGDEALGVTELRPAQGFYDYDAKYTDGLTTHVLPADIAQEVAAAACDIAVRAHRSLGCAGVSRSDFRFDDSKGVDGLYLLEVNTQPGMTPLSLVPEQAAYRGIGFDELVQRLVDMAA